MPWELPLSFDDFNKETSHCSTVSGEHRCINDGSCHGFLCVCLDSSDDDDEASLIVLVVGRTAAILSLARTNFEVDDNLVDFAESRTW